jgi:hypothetical protein
MISPMAGTCKRTLAVAALQPFDYSKRLAQTSALASTLLCCAHTAVTLPFGSTGAARSVTDVAPAGSHKS